MYFCFGSLSMTGRDDIICIRPIVALSSTVHMDVAHTMELCQKREVTLTHYQENQ